jgi:hypothetical protein
VGGLSDGCGAWGCGRGGGTWEVAEVQKFRPKLAFQCACGVRLRGSGALDASRDCKGSARILLSTGRLLWPVCGVHVSAPAQKAVGGERRVVP